MFGTCGLVPAHGPFLTLTPKTPILRLAFVFKSLVYFLAGTVCKAGLGYMQGWAPAVTARGTVLGTV